MEASGSTRRVHGYFENPINLVFFPSLSPSLSLSLHPYTSSDRAMKFPRRPNLSLFPGHSGYTIRYPRAFLSSTSLLPLLSTPFHPNLSLASPPLLIPLFPSSIYLSIYPSPSLPVLVHSLASMLLQQRRDPSSSPPSPLTRGGERDTARSNAASQTGRKRKISVSSDDDRADDSFSKRPLKRRFAWFRAPLDFGQSIDRGRNADISGPDIDRSSAFQHFDRVSVMVAEFWQSVPK